MTVAPVADALLGARYRLTSLIATGGMGEVWSATDEVLGRNVAVKVLRSEYVGDPVFLERFRSEAQHTAALSHPGIAAIYDYYDGTTAEGEVALSPFLVMENVPGEPLSSVLARDGALSADHTLDVIAQAAFALQAAHDAGVIHRDVKPGNILLRPDGVVKITDFGISRATNSLPLTVTGAVMGTAFYLSPEQASGQPLTPASDVYSLGVVAYECLAGVRPFTGETPAAVALAQVRDEPPAMGDGVRPEVAALVLRMLAKSPEDRPPSAGELAGTAQDLRAALDRPDTVTRPLALTPMGDAATTTALRMPSESRLPRWVPVAVGLGVLAVVLALVLHGFVNTGGASGPSTPTPSASSPVPVLVRAADYLGKPVAEATATLSRLGLIVSLRPVVASRETPIGTVTGVTPTGRLHPGDIVTLEVAKAGPPPGKQKKPEPPGQKKKKDDRKQGKP
jgi:serine/threonine protein kinase